MKKNILFIAAGLALVVLFQLQRAPGIYNALWGDEICNNHAFLASPSSLHALSKNVCYFFKPVADFAIKKWGWFQLFEPTEAGFSLVPWFYAGVSLLLVLLVPWTRFKEIGLVGVALIGLCGLETRFSYEAQCYSFSSLTSWLTLYGFGWAFSRLDRGRVRDSYWIALAATMLGLNSHFFAWPYVGAGALLYSVVFMRAVPKESKRMWFLLLALGMTTVLVTTVMVNIYPIFNLVFTPPQSSAEFVLKWRMAWGAHMGHWAWASVPLPLYAVVSVAALFHPDRPKRFLAWVAAIATGPALYLVHLTFTARSHFPMQERYLIAYIAPTLFLFLLGLDNVASRLTQWNSKRGTAVVIVAVVALFFHFGNNVIGKQFPIFVDEVRTGWSALREKPMNYTPHFAFFEKVKSYQRPVLVLSNQCWLLPVPDMYMRYMGTKLPKDAVEVVNVAGCETSPSALVIGIGSFLEKHGDKALILAFLENKGALPCAAPFPALFQDPDLAEGCHALYEAKDLAPWVRKTYGVPASVAGMRVEEVAKPYPFLRKVLAPYIFTLVPLVMIGFFIFVFYFFRLRL